MLAPALAQALVPVLAPALAPVWAPVLMLGLALGSTRRHHSQSLHQNNSAGNTSWRSKSSSCTASLAVWLCEMHTSGPCSSSTEERHCCTASRCRSHPHSRSQQQSSSADNICF